MNSINEKIIINLNIMIKLVIKAKENNLSFFYKFNLIY